MSVKTRKAFTKRFKVTGTGKVMRRTPGRRHLLRKKSSRQLATSRGDKQVSEGFSIQVRKAMPHSF